MIPSMFTLDHRLAELRPSAAELRVARELRDAAEEAVGSGRSIDERVRTPRGSGSLSARPSRAAMR
jgi:hypothetical protein